MLRRFYVLFGLVVFGCLLFADPAMAQSLTLNVGEASPSGSVTARIFNVILMITVLSIAPSILVMMTSFTRIIVVFSITRSALATQATPPNMVLLSLALFLTFLLCLRYWKNPGKKGLSRCMKKRWRLKKGWKKRLPR